METNTPPQTNNLQFSISFFRNLWSKESTTITLEELYQLTTGTLWKPQTECYRRIKDLKGRENEAKMVKYGMCATIMEGRIRPHCSHATANLEKMSGLAMYDLDHTNERTEAIKDRFRQLPYVAFAQNSISNEGLKVIVFLDVYTPQEYPLAYAICKQTLERIAAHPCDDQCDRITQPCSCVWDANAYYNPTPEPYPWRQELAADPQLRQLDPKNKFHSEGTGTPTPIGSLLPEACGYINTFIKAFSLYNPWQKGNRHQCMLAMGRSARRKGFSKEELEKLTSIMSVEIVGNGYTQKELEKDLLSGYQYINSNSTPATPPNSLTLQTTDTLRGAGVRDSEDEKEDVLIKNELIRRDTPTIPNEVYQHLPDFLKRALKAARTARERDMLLLGLITNLSACLPKVTINYDQCIYSPHLYLLIIASSATGKGLLKMAGILPTAINEHLKKENKRKKQQYLRELAEWEKKNHPSSKTPSGENMPEPPIYITLCGSPNTSKSQIIKRLRDNGETGLIINATELDMISSAIKQECGKYDDVFCAGFHHEPVSTDYKVDGDMITVEVPHLALCLTGTPNQLLNFIRSIENGLYSRFIPYTSGAEWKFRSAAPIKGQKDYNSLFKELSEEVLSMYLFLQQSPTEVVLSESQWEYHTAYFNKLLNEVAGEQSDAPGSIVLRGGLIVARIASIFTALRKTEGAMQMKEYICTDEDFYSAMKIVDTTLNHSLLLLSSLPGEAAKVKPMKPYFRLRPIIDTFTGAFTYTEIKEKALTAHITERTLCRYLIKLVSAQYIKKEGDKYIKVEKTIRGTSL